jgi:carbon storage regulator
MDADVRRKGVGTPLEELSRHILAGVRPQRGMPMLVLSRKKNESIIINDHIVVTVVEIRGDKVRLGIDAPKDVSVHRREVYEAIQSQSKVREAGAVPEPGLP